MKLVKFFALAVAAVAMVSCEKPEENKGGDGGDVIVQEFVKIYCDVNATEWETVGVWAWSDAEGANYTGGTWPGEALTETESVDGKTCYIWNAPKDLVGKEIGFIVNQFVDGGEQTVDLTLTVEDGAMVVLTEKGADGKWLASVNGEEVVEPEPEPEPVVVLGEHTWGVIGSFNEWSADVEMTINGNSATATITVDAGAKFKVRADANWDEINYGFTATEELTAVPVDGTEFPAAFKGADIELAEAGEYEIVLTIEGETETFKITKK